MRPETYVLAPDASALVIHWADRPPARLAAPMLRAAARDAASVRRRFEQRVVQPREDLTISAVNPMGSMGVNICFSDGHDRALYPWGYLREIADGGGAAPDDN